MIIISDGWKTREMGDSAVTHIVLELSGKEMYDCRNDKEMRGALAEFILKELGL